MLLNGEIAQFELSNSQTHLADVFHGSSSMDDDNDSDEIVHSSFIPTAKPVEFKAL
jgi:hypothetical protein